MTGQVCPFLRNMKKFLHKILKKPYTNHKINGIISVVSLGHSNFQAENHTKTQRPKKKFTQDFTDN